MELVSFKTAQLAQEKGFQEPCLYYFSTDGQEKSFSEDGMYFYSRGEHGRLVLRPQQSELQKWLRDIHDIHIEIIYYDQDASEKVYGLDINLPGKKHKRKYFDWGDVNNDYKTYEQALEIGLEEALKLI